MATQRLRD